MTDSVYEEHVDKIMDDYAAEASARRPFSPMTVDPTYLLMVIARARQVERPHRHLFRCSCGYQLGAE